MTAFISLISLRLRPPHIRAAPITVACLLLLASCDRDRSESSDVAEPAPPLSAPQLGVHRPEDLVTAATEVIGFLRGDIPFARIRLADTVTLHLSPEGGGTQRKAGRAALRNPSSWNIRSNRPSARGMIYSFVPHEDLTALTTRVGRHLNCMESDLSSLYPELATLPHVGTMLTRAKANESCLQTWNLTLVFDSGATPPTLVAAVYDQWEW